MATIYFIGGSPCSGKSTIAEILSERYGLQYFKVDDHLEEYTIRGAEDNLPICKKQIEWNAEQIWMRDPVLQCKDEIIFYEEIFDYIWEDLNKVNQKGAVVTEGAAYFPHIMKKLHVPEEQYAAITPTKDFQISHYKEREWVPYILEGCSDKEKAFQNWMGRDSLFADTVCKECMELNYLSIVNDGGNSINEMVQIVSAHFGWKV